jgi:hypothetical protein
MTPTLHRVLPLTGVLFAGLTLVGDAVIGPFPEGAPSPARLAAYYGDHAGQVALGGTVLAAAAIAFAVFAAAVWARTRAPGVPLVVPGLVLLGGAVEAGVQLTGAETYRVLGDVGTAMSPAALQAWHVAGSEFFAPGGLAVLLLGVALAGIGYRAVPRWLGWTAILVAVALFTPVAFEASLLATLWAAAAGIALAVRPRVPVPARIAEPVV